jgi:triphosphoribosyl-dephospho-CoA synthase
MSSARGAVGLHAQVACIWEATARKPGNVHRYHDFADTGYLDFLTSAAAIAPVLADAGSRPLGETIREALRATRGVARGNTNLGIVLLLAPLAKAEAGADYRGNLKHVLQGLTLEDARVVYRAIADSQAGGLGEAPEEDVRQAPTVPLRHAMALAADRDLVARQYSHGFVEVFDEAAPAVLEGMALTGCLEGGIIGAHLRLMSRHGDSLIRRKRGQAESDEAAGRAAAVLAAGWPATEQGREALAALDRWLRAEGNQRNPGTTADLIAAGLFVLLRQGQVSLPLEVPWELPEGAL